MMLTDWPKSKLSRKDVLAIVPIWLFINWTNHEQFVGRLIKWAIEDEIILALFLPYLSLILQESYNSSQPNFQRNNTMDPKVSGSSNTSHSSNSTGGGQDNKDINKTWKGVLSQLQPSTSVSLVDTWTTERKLALTWGPGPSRSKWRTQKHDLSPLKQDWKLCNSGCRCSPELRLYPQNSALTKES